MNTDAKHAVACDYYLGRQPILGPGGELVAYECLFRTGTANAAHVVDNVAATASVIKHAFLDMGIEVALGNKTGFINISDDILITDIIELLPPHRVVFEVLETTRVTQIVIDRVQALRSAGYRIALDDVTAHNQAVANLLPFTDIVKVDILGMSPDMIACLFSSLRPHVKTLLAEKVETEAEFVHCRALGFELFQGYFFAKPSVITGKAIQPVEPTLIKLLSALAADAELEELEDILKHLPDLTLRLVTMANTAALRRIHKIKTVRQAIIVLGRNQLRRLVKIVLFARASPLPTGADPLLQTAILRGRLMELVAESRCHSEVRRHAFMVGLLSFAHVLFRQPLPDVLASIRPDEKWVAALLHREGELGHLLKMVEAVEIADDEQLHSSLAALGCHDLVLFTKAHIEALHWANNF